MGGRWLVELRQRLGRGFGHVLAAMQPGRRNDGVLLPGLYRSRVQRTGRREDGHVIAVSGRRTSGEVC
jgi:hypothetical protein